MSQLHHFAVYEVATGKVLRVGSGVNPRIAEAQRLNEGEAIYAGKIDPDRQFLPAGFPSDKPAEIIVVTADQVKQHAGRLLSYTDWYVTRDLEGGGSIPGPVASYRQAVRDRSGEIEAMDPIPADYQNPKWWPVAP